jgi:hypothetical protein
MLQDAETHRSVARQRERDLLKEAEQERQARAARERNRGSDKRRRDG